MNHVDADQVLTEDDLRTLHRAVSDKPWLRAFLKPPYLKQLEAYETARYDGIGGLERMLRGYRFSAV